jgi:glycosyltransferase involved in cell wall biosynthesis
MSIDCLKNIEVVELPAVNSYLGALRDYKKYCEAIERVKPLVDFFYCRVPDPFCWLPVLKYKMPSVMHFVGDTIDATRHNEKWSWLRKQVMIAGYLPEYALMLLASRKSRVYTNGTHLSSKLAKLGVNATAVISSTISEKQLQTPPILSPSVPPRMIYVGYLRFAKGMNLLMNLWLRLKEKWPDFRFGVVGNGEMEEDIRRFVDANNLSDNILMYGRIDNRTDLINVLRSSDLFVFPSLSEGSPRVVIEAMAEGIPVISTPVGSLPGTFTDGDAIRYFGFNDDLAAFRLVCEYCEAPQRFYKMRDRAYKSVCDNFTIEKFLSKIYSLDK